MKNHKAEHAFGIAIAALFIFFIIAILRATGKIGNFDNGIMKHIFYFRNITLTAMTSAFIDLFNVLIVVTFTVFSSLILIKAGKKNLSILCAGSMGLGVVSFLFLKDIFKFGRPVGRLVDVLGYGFPSGHATMATILFLFLAYLYTHTDHRLPFRYLFYFLMGFMIVSVGLSRIYLGVHYPSDVLAGFALGTFSFFIVDGLILYYGGNFTTKPRKKSRR